MYLFESSFYIYISLLILFFISAKQYHNKSPALIFSVSFLLYVILPLIAPINFLDLDNKIFEDASLLTFYFSFGYLLAQYISVGLRVDILKNLNIYIISSKKLYMMFFVFIAIYIMTVSIYAEFDRAISSSYLNNRIQIIYVFCIAIILWSTESKLEKRLIYVLIASVGLMMLYSGSRIYVAPGLIFISLYYLTNSNNNKIFIYFSILLMIIILLLTSLFRNLDGDLFSFKSIVSTLGEFYFTNLSFLIVLDRELYFPHNFIEAFGSILFPYFYPNVDVNSDKFVNQYSNFDFGLASSLLNDIALYAGQTFPIYIISGFLIGIIYKTIADKFLGISYLFCLVFLSFTPILFRSSLFYLFSLIKSMVIYITIIIFVSFIVKFLKR